MRITTLFILISFMHLSASTRSQTITLDAKEQPLEKILDAVRQQVGFAVLYNAPVLRNARLVSVHVKNLPLEAFMQQVFAGQPLKYTIDHSTILIVGKAESPVIYQPTIFKGIVKDEKGEPLQNVTVKNTATGKAVVTDANGSFSIEGHEGDMLKISLLGFFPQERSLGASLTLAVIMKEDKSTLDEVIVVAYGTTKKKDFTGSFVNISADDIKKQQLSTVSRALEGAVAGVQVSSGTGQPGADATIRVRGMGSINASNNPLIVVDGSVSNLPLSALNPDDIESLVVSKDAAANAIYGSRASNGLILVTTKQGKQGNTRIGFDMRLGATSQGVPDYDMVKDPATYYEYTWQGIYNYMRYNQKYSDEDARQYASTNLFTANGSNNTGNGLGNYLNYNIPDGTTLIDPATGKIRSEAKLLYHDDWQDYFLKTTLRQEYNVNIGGATEKTDYYVSMNMLKNPSYVMGSDFDRYSSRVNLNTKISSWLKGGVNMSYSRTYSNAPTSYTGGPVNTNIFTFLNLFSPTYPIYAYDKDGNIIKDADGNATFDLGSGQTYSPYGVTKRVSFNGYSPAIYFDKDLTETTTDFFTGRSYLEASFWKDFKFKVDLAVDNQYVSYKNYGNNESGSDARDYNGIITETWSKALTINLDQLLTWNKDFGTHHVDALIGHEYNHFQTNNMSGTKYKLYSLDNPYLSNAVRVLSLNGGQSETALEGYFSRFNYNYAGKYYASASIRRDGSSYFRDNRWGTFWSLGGAYRISEEPFLKDNSHWINELKIRASYGVQGNNGIPANLQYAWTNTYSLSSSGSITDADFALAASTWGDPSITWESNQIWDVGVDYRFWNRFYGTVDYFHRKTVDMLLSVSYPASSGRSGALQNVGKLLNTGLEVEMGVDLIKKKDWHWSFDVNASHYKTTLLEIPDNMGSAELGGGYLSGNYLRREGDDYFNLYMYKYAGVDQSTGLGLLYKKLKEADMANFPDNKVGDVVTTTDGSQATRFELGTASPKVMGGVSTSLRYKDFDLGIAGSWQLGGKVVSRTYQYITTQTIGRGISTDMLNAWTPENTSSNIPMRMLGGTNYGSQPVGGSEGQYSDFSLFSAHYFNLKTVTLGYTLPSKIAKKWQFENFRVYISAQNLFFASAKKGLDPREPIDGATVNPFGYPQVREISLGLNIQL
ncbi:TonB-linked outer membrane protein, SusC/RagA family [bacterium A37T11]|nr:TonB-linked outer membrane protein, SusC/RagA family [bacterium A37T11]